MPAPLLSVPHLRQSSEASCLAACAREDVAHACVLVGLSDRNAYLQDPWLDSGPVEVSLTEFMAAWTEMDHLAALISPGA